MHLRSGRVTGTSSPTDFAGQQPSVSRPSATGELGDYQSARAVSPHDSLTDLGLGPQERAHHAPGADFGLLSPAIGGWYGPQQVPAGCVPIMVNPVFAQFPPGQLPVATSPWGPYGLPGVGVQQSAGAYLPPSFSHINPSLPGPGFMPAGLPDGPRVRTQPVSPRNLDDDARSSTSSAVDQLAEIVRQQQEQLAQQSILMQQQMQQQQLMFQQLMGAGGTGVQVQRSPVDDRPTAALQELKLQTTYDSAAAACPKLKRLEPRVIVQWVRQAKKHFRRYTIGDAHILERLSTIIVDKAGDWLDNKLLLQSTGAEPEWLSLDDFLDKLQEDHPEPVASFTVLQELISPKVKQAGRTVGIYHSELVKLFTTEHHSFDQRFQVGYFVLGLDIEIQQQLMRSYPATLREAYTAAAALEASIKPAAARRDSKFQAEEQRQLHRQLKELRDSRVQFVDRFKHVGQRHGGVPTNLNAPAPQSSPAAVPPASSSGNPGASRDSRPRNVPYPRRDKGQPAVHSIFLTEAGDSLVLDGDGLPVSGDSYLIDEEAMAEMRVSLKEEPHVSWKGLRSSGQ